MKIAADSVEAYLAAMPEERRAALEAVRAVILKNLPAGYVECMQYGMIGYVVPRERFPNTYNGQPLALAALGAQKNYLVAHLMSLYGDTKMRAWFEEAYRKAGKKLDAGQACVRFKGLEDVALEVVGEAIARCPVEKLIAWHERAQAQRSHKRPARGKTGQAAKKAGKTAR